MRDDLGDLRAMVLEQGFALDIMKQASNDAEEHQKTFHEELLRMTAKLTE